MYDASCTFLYNTSSDLSQVSVAAVVLMNRDAREGLRTLGYGEHAGTAEPIFWGQRGPLTPRGVQLLLARYARAAGLQRVTPHVLHHSFCKNLVNVRVGLEKIALLAA